MTRGIPTVGWLPARKAGQGRKMAWTVDDRYRTATTATPLPLLPLHRSDCGNNANVVGRSSVCASVFRKIRFMKFQPEIGEIYLIFSFPAYRRRWCPSERRIMPSLAVTNSKPCAQGGSSSPPSLDAPCCSCDINSVPTLGLAHHHIVNPSEVAVAAMLRCPMPIAGMLNCCERRRLHCRKQKGTLGWHLLLRRQIR